MEDMLRAATPLVAPFPRLLALEMLAAALWAREAWTRLESVVEEIAVVSPTRWRTALHRAHLAFATGQDDAAAKELAAARGARLPAELLHYVWGLEAAGARRSGGTSRRRRDTSRDDARRERSSSPPTRPRPSSGPRPRSSSRRSLATSLRSSSGDGSRAAMHMRGSSPAAWRGSIRTRSGDASKRRSSALRRGVRTTSSSRRFCCRRRVA